MSPGLLRCERAPDQKDALPDFSRTIPEMERRDLMGPRPVEDYYRAWYTRKALYLFYSVFGNFFLILI